MSKPIVKTLGGDRLGSGSKNKEYLHNYERSTHDLSESFKSTIGAGILYPCYVNVGTNGDTFEINTNAGLRTIPTRGPLFGSFKMQIDYFMCPIRLYQGILHNNPINIGLKMAQVKLPRMSFKQRQFALTETRAHYIEDTAFAPNSLEKYLGLSGLGMHKTGVGYDGVFSRELECVPELAYYDIFKNYYANKQEEKAYVITKEVENITSTIANAQIEYFNTDDQEIVSAELEEITDAHNNDYYTATNSLATSAPISFALAGTNLRADKILLNYSGPIFSRKETLKKFDEMGVIKITNQSATSITFNWTNLYSFAHGDGSATITFPKHATYNAIGDLKLKAFDLENIDQMRYEILSFTALGGVMVIDENNAYYPYKALTDTYIKDEGLDTERLGNKNELALNGLVVKTYQSDLFNNWVQTEWIDGENGINAITSVQTTEGAFTIDALNLASKVYNMLNRIAISGGTYQDWQEAVYAEKAVMHAESPIYLGGMSSEIVFDEVVSTAATEEDALGTLGGRGRLNGKKGGKIICKFTEPAFIIGILSLTPRIDQTQGNAWFRTELDSVDDLHKPELDQIGFQELLEEQMAWWASSRPKPSGDPSETTENYQPSVGKVPAWINYMTAVDKAYGDFARDKGKAFMILSRNYDVNEETGNIQDATTYIDPSKYNYAFAYTELDAQNFWVQIHHDVKARRKMSAKQIPNL